jgi:hypothetical protein
MKLSAGYTLHHDIHSWNKNVKLVRRSPKQWTMQLCTCMLRCFINSTICLHTLWWPRIRLALHLKWIWDEEDFLTRRTKMLAAIESTWHHPQNRRTQSLSHLDHFKFTSCSGWQRHISGSLLNATRMYCQWPDHTAIYPTFLLKLLSSFHKRTIQIWSTLTSTCEWSLIVILYGTRNEMLHQVKAC